MIAKLNTAKSYLIAAGLSVAVGATQGSAQDESGLMRDFPYPYSHIFSIASDADSQDLAYGVAVHRLLNEEIGLPISDSTWPQNGGRRNDWSLFNGADQLGFEPITLPDGRVVGRHQEVVRQWHRGNVDHFHMWMTDVDSVYTQNLEPALTMVDGMITVTFDGPNGVNTVHPKHNIGLEVSRSLPSDAYVTIWDTQDRQIQFSMNETLAARLYEEPGGSPNYDLIITRDVLDRSQDGDQFDTRRIARVEIRSNSCANNANARGCNSELSAVHIRNFSRRSVAMQLEYLIDWDIRPLVATSHGGHTLTMNIGVLDTYRDFPDNRGNPYRDPQRRARAGEPGGDYFHIDLLHRLGLTYIRNDTLQGIGRGHLQDFPYPENRASEQGDFYHLWTTTLRPLVTANEEAFVASALAHEPYLEGFDVSGAYCGPRCNEAQGGTISLLAYSAIGRVRAGLTVENLWYTHFATGWQQFQTSPEHRFAEPFSEGAVAAFRLMADHARNYSGTIPDEQRIWVTPAGVAPRYLTIRSDLPDHISVSENTVQIEPWLDEATQRIVPNPSGQDSDLQGFTFYVSDAARGRVLIGDQELFDLQRNPPDSTGRESVTIVDTSRPSRVFDTEFDGLVELRRASDKVDVDLTPIKLYNSTAIRFALVGSGSPVLRFETSDMRGRSLAIIPETLPAEDRESYLADAVGVVTYDPDIIAHDGLRRYVLPLSAIEWTPFDEATESRPGLPLGTPLSLTVEKTQGGRASLEFFDVLRPNSTFIDEGAPSLVAGRVVSGEVGVPNTPVVMTLEGNAEGGTIEETTLTDELGYFSFGPQPTGGTMSVYSITGTGRCFSAISLPRRHFRSDAEVDIDLDECGIIASSQISVRPGALALTTSGIDANVGPRACSPVQIGSSDVLLTASDGAVGGLYDVGQLIRAHICQSDQGATVEDLDVAQFTTLADAWAQSLASARPDLRGETVSVNLILITTFDEYDVPLYDQASQIGSLEVTIDAGGGVEIDASNASLNFDALTESVRRSDSSSPVISSEN